MSCSVLQDQDWQLLLSQAVIHFVSLCCSKSFQSQLCAFVENARKACVLRSTLHFLHAGLGVGVSLYRSAGLVPEVDVSEHVDEVLRTYVVHGQTWQAVLFKVFVCWLLVSEPAARVWPARLPLRLVLLAWLRRRQNLLAGSIIVWTKMFYKTWQG